MGGGWVLWSSLMLSIQLSICFGFFSAVSMLLTTTFLSVVCFDMALSWRSRTVGSDCLAQGSSSTVSPRVSGLLSGRVIYTAKLPNFIQQKGYWHCNFSWFHFICWIWVNWIIFFISLHTIHVHVYRYITKCVLSSCRYYLFIE